MVFAKGTLAAVALHLLVQTASALTTQTLYTFPNPTWLENIAVSRADGAILVTELQPSPRVHRIDPDAAAPTPQVVAQLDTLVPGVSGAAGIAADLSDPFTFYVGGLNFSLSSASSSTSVTLFKLQLDKHNPSAPGKLSVLATFSDGTLLNGLVALNRQTLLGADTTNARVFAIDLVTGTSRVILQGAPYGPVGQLGINGLKILRPRFPHGNTTYLYFTDTTLDTLSRIPIDPHTAAPLGDPETLATVPPSVDDFAIDPFTGTSYVTTATGNTISTVPRDGGAATVIAGNLNSTAIDQPTGAALAFGPRGPKKLYVSTTGGIAEGPPASGGQIVLIELPRGS